MGETVFVFLAADSIQPWSRLKVDSVFI